MTKMLNFSEFINESADNEIVESLSGISTVMNKVISFNKREMVATECVTNESFRAMHHYNQDIFFSYEERDAIKEMFKEFVPRVLDSMINEFNEAGCEFDENIFSEIGLSDELNEGWMTDKIKSAWNKVSSAAKTVANKTGAVVDNAKEYVEDSAKKLKDAAVDVKKKVVEKYKSIMDFLKKLIEMGAKSVKEFIASIGRLFEKIGGCIKDALKKLGAFESEKDEYTSTINLPSDMVKDISENEGETSFIKHIVSYMGIMMGDNKKKVDELIGEGIENIQFNFDEEELNEGLMDKIANNKFIQFILCYGKGKKISIWKSILISIAGSIIISCGLPVILPICGVGVAAVPTCVAAVQMVWSFKSAFKVVLNRYVNKKPGEKLFDKKTCLLLAIAVLPQIPPFKEWIQDAFGAVLHWLGIDKWLENASQTLGQLIEKLHGHNPSLKMLHDSWDENVTRGGSVGEFSGKASNAALAQHGQDLGMNDKQLSIFDRLLNGGKHIMGSTKLHKFWDSVLGKDGDVLPKGFIQDTNVPGVNALYKKAVEDVMQNHQELINGPIGGQAFYDSVNGAYGDCNIVVNCSDAVQDEINKKFVSMGGHLSDLHFTQFGHDIIKNIVHHPAVFAPVNWLFDSIKASFGINFIPWLDEKKWGDYQMSFGSNTSKLPYHVVNEVKLMDMSDAQKYISGSNTAFNKLVAQISSFQNIHQSFIKFVDDKEDKTKDEKKFVKQQNKNFERNGNLQKRKVLVFFVEAKDKKTGKTNPKTPGFMIDMLSMLCVDICDSFRTPRKNPYYVKGMLSKLSFKPVKKNDNEMKQYIRTMLGDDAGHSVQRMYDFGLGSCIVEKKDDKFVPGAKAESKELPYLGNFTPEEYCEILNDKSKDFAVAYSYLSGKYGSTSGLSSKNGDKVKHDSNTIENRRYVSADTPIKDDKEVTVRTKDGTKKNKKYSEMKKYQADRYGMRRATPDEIKSGVKTMDYVEARIIPIINDKNSKLHKELVKDDDIRKVFFKKDGETVKKGLLLSIKDYLYRAESSFSEKDEHNALEKMNAYRKEHDYKEYGDDVYETIKKTVELIWELKGKHSNARKRNRIVTESRFMSFDKFISLND